MHLRLGYLQQGRLTPSKIEDADLVKMLGEWRDDHKDMLLSSSPEDFADIVIKYCTGHPSLTGFCCHILSLEAESANACQKRYSAENFDDLLEKNFKRAVKEERTFCNLLQDLKGNLSSDRADMITYVSSFVVKTLEAYGTQKSFFSLVL